MLFALAQSLLVTSSVTALEMTALLLVTSSVIALSPLSSGSTIHRTESPMNQGVGVITHDTHDT